MLKPKAILATRLLRASNSFPIYTLLSNVPGAAHRDALSSRGPPHASESDESDVINRDADHAQDRNNTASTMVTDWWSNRPDTPSDDESIVVNRDADHAQDQNNTASTMVTDWWSNRSDTPSDRGEQDDTGYFSDGLVEELRRRTGSGSGSATPRPAGSSGGE